MCAIAKIATPIPTPAMLPAPGTAPAPTGPKPEIMDDPKRFNRSTPLIEAVIAQDEAKVAECLAVERPRVDAVDANDVTALLHACSYGNTNIVNALLNKNARPYMADRNGITPLMRAAMNSHADAAAAVLGRGGDVRDEQKDGSTALHFAAARGNLAIVELLLADRMQKPDVAKKDGSTPLWLAASSGHVDVVKRLIAAGAKVNVECNGWSALMNACMEGHAEVAKLLVDAGADASQTDETGSTPLMSACSQGSEDVAVALIDAGVDLEATDEDGQTALFVSAANGEADMVTALRKRGANARVATGDGTTALMAAAKFGHDDCVEALLAPVAAAGDGGGGGGASGAGGGGSGAPAPIPSPADVIADIDAAKAAKDAAPKPADVNARDSEGRTALWFAAQQGYDAIVKMLLAEDGVDATLATTADGVTPFMVAAEDGNTGILRKLLLKSPRAHREQAKDGRTALWIAAHNGRQDTVQYLLRIGSDPTIRARGEPAVSTAALGGDRRASGMRLHKSASAPAVGLGAGAGARDADATTADASASAQSGGLTPRETAEQQGHTGVTALLKEKWPSMAQKHGIASLVSLVRGGRAELDKAKVRDAMPLPRGSARATSDAATGAGARASAASGRAAPTQGKSGGDTPTGAHAKAHAAATVHTIVQGLATAVSTPRPDDSPKTPAAHTREQVRLERHALPAKIRAAAGKAHARVRRAAEAAHAARGVAMLAQLAEHAEGDKLLRKTLAMI